MNKLVTLIEHNQNVSSADARRVLEKANFEFKAPFDVIQDFYQNNHQLEKSLL